MDVDDGNGGEETGRLVVLAANLGGSIPATAANIQTFVEAAASVATATPGAEALTGAFAAIDRLPPLVNEFAQMSLTQAFADAALADGSDAPWLARLATSGGDGDGGGEAAVAMAVAARLFKRDLIGARALTDALAARPGLRPWSYILAAKVAALGGDLAGAETLLGRAVSTYGAGFHMCGFLAAVVRAQGRLDEAQDHLRRAATCFRPDALAARRTASAAHARDLGDLVAAGVADSGDGADALLRIGASANYALPASVPEKWEMHSRVVDPDNQFLTIAAYTNEVMFAAALALMDADRDLRKLVNYGTLAGVREDALAARHLDRVFAGYDISAVATALNRARFRRSNLIFDDDLDALFGRLSALPGGTLLVHCRTADIMLPEAVRRVYGACRRHGVRHLLSAEYVAPAIHDYAYPDFDSVAAETVHWDGILVMHDHPRLMAEAGFRVTDDRFLPVPLPASAGGEGRPEGLLIRLVSAEAAP